MSLKLKQVKQTTKLAPSWQPFRSPEGSAQQISNMVYPRRGAVVTCDGSLAVFTPASVGESTGHGAFLAFAPYQPTSGALIPVCLQNAPLSHLASPVLLSVTQITGTWPAGTYTFAITAQDGAGNETLISNVIPITFADNVHGPRIAWAAVIPNAIYYNVYQLVGGTYFAILDGIAGNLTAVNIPNPLPISSQSAPLVNITEQTVFRQMTVFPYNDTTILEYLPSGPVNATGIAPIGVNLSVNGGQIGAISGMPQLIPFFNGIVLALGNGIAPQFWTGFGAPTNLTNTWAAAWPTWTASAFYPPGSVVVPTPTNGFFYQSTQGGNGGTSGAAQPAFPTAIGASVSDGSVVWTNLGPTAIVAPRGAAHATSHGGFLYLFNTYPGQSQDGLDSVTTLKQSALNNPNSWNPQNNIQVGAYDGQEGMGMQAFTIAEAGIAPYEVLMLFKNFSTYVMTGFMPNQSLAQVKTDKGCTAPRTIQYVAELQGVMRMTHQGIAITDGISDEIAISDDIRPYITGDPNVPGITPLDPQYIAFCQSTLTAKPTMYVMAGPLPGNQGKLNRLICFDVVLKSWTVIDLPFFVYAMYQQKPTAYSTVLETRLGGFTDGIARRWQAGDITWDTGAQVTWNVLSDSQFGDDPTNRLYVRNILIRGLGLSSPLTFSAIVQTNDINLPAARPRVYQFASGSIELEVPVDLTVLDTQVKLSGTGKTEIDTMAWQVEEKPVVPQWNCP